MDRLLPMESKLNQKRSLTKMDLTSNQPTGYRRRLPNIDEDLPPEDPYRMEGIMSKLKEFL